MTTYRSGQAVDEATHAPAEPDAPAQRDGVAGRVTVSNSALAKLAARAAVEVPDIGPAGSARFGFGRASLPRTSAEVDGARARIEMTISVRWPAPLGHVTMSLREHLRRRVADLTGLSVADIRLTVADLTTPSSPRVR